MAKKLPVITVKRYGKDYLRSRPEHVNLSAASRQSAAIFGTASILAAQLAATFKPIAGPAKDQRIYHRLLAALVAWKQEQQNTNWPPCTDSSYFQHFRFNRRVALASRIKLKPIITYGQDDVTIALPAFVPTEVIMAPRGCREVVLQWMAVSSDPFTGEVLGCSSDYKLCVYDNTLIPPQQIQLLCAQQRPCLVLLAFSVKYHFSEGAFIKPGDDALMPGEIISSRYG